MIEHISYPSIEQFRNAIHSVCCRARFVGKDVNGDPIYDQTIQAPILKYRGTVKLHGTNAAIGLDRASNEFWFQSRENIIKVGKDNAGFASHFHGKNLQNIFRSLVLGDKITIFGEWCGQGIQSSVAIGKLPKMFVIFDILIDEVWQSKSIVEKIKDEAVSVFNIYDYQTEEIEIDFNCPEKSLEKLTELTTRVADCCPVGHSFGVDGVGEGIVWSCITAGYEEPKFKFKVKDERHAFKGSNKKVSIEVDTQSVANMMEFVNLVVTEGRCRQGVDKMKERGLKTDRSCLGHYVSWVFDDVVKEETDVAVKSNIDLGKARSDISKKAREWFMKHELEF